MEKFLNIFLSFISLAFVRHKAVLRIKTTHKSILKEMSLPSSFFKSIPIPSFFSLHSHSPYAGDQSHLFMIYSSYVFFFFQKWVEACRFYFYSFVHKRKNTLYTLASCFCHLKMYLGNHSTFVHRDLLHLFIHYLVLYHCVDKPYSTALLGISIYF